MELGKKGTVSILLSGILMGTLPIFVRSLELSALEITFFRFMLGFIFLAIPTIVKKKCIFLRNRVIIFLSFFNILTIFFYISSLQLSKAAISALLLYMAPVYVMIINFIKYKKFDIEILTIGIIGILGLYFMLKPCQKLSEGIIYGFISGIFYAFVFVLAKEARKIFGAQEITVSVLGLGTMFYLPLLMLSSNFSMKNLSLNFMNTDQILILLGLGLIPTAIPFTLFNYGIKYCRVEKAPILALIEPVSVSIVGFLFFKEVLSLTQFFGAGLVLLSIFLSFREHSSK